MPFSQPGNWHAPEVDAIGTNLTIAAGNTLNATSGGGGSVTAVIVGAGLHPTGTITNAGSVLADMNVGVANALGGFLQISGTVLTDINQGTISLSGTTTGTITPGNHSSFLVNVGTANGTIAIAPGAIGQPLRLDIKQGATPHTVSFDSTVSFGATVPSYTATNTANDVDEIMLFQAQDGTHWRLAAVSQGFTL